MTPQTCPSRSLRSPSEKLKPTSRPIVAKQPTSATKPLSCPKPNQSSAMPRTSDAAWLAAVRQAIVTHGSEFNEHAGYGRSNRPTGAARSPSVRVKFRRQRHRLRWPRRHCRRRPQSQYRPCRKSMMSTRYRRRQSPSCRQMMATRLRHRCITGCVLMTSLRKYRLSGGYSSDRCPAATFSRRYFPPSANPRWSRYPLRSASGRIRPGRRSALPSRARNSLRGDFAEAHVAAGWRHHLAVVESIAPLRQMPVEHGEADL